MADRRSTSHDLPRDQQQRENVARLRSAIRELRVSREQLAELQECIKGILGEEKEGFWQFPIELLVIERFQQDWETWRKRPLYTIQPALKECFAALRHGVSLLQVPNTSPSPVDDVSGRVQSAMVGSCSYDSHPLAADLVNLRETDTGREACLTPSASRQPHTETDSLPDEFLDSALGRHYIRHLQGLPHEVLVIRDVPRGKPKLVIVERGPLEFNLSSNQQGYRPYQTVPSWATNCSPRLRT